jgi:hypothetical protein
MVIMNKEGPQVLAHVALRIFSLWILTHGLDMNTEFQIFVSSGSGLERRNQTISTTYFAAPT